MKNIYWTTKTTPAPLRTMLNTLSTNYPITKTNEKEANLTFIKSENPGACKTTHKGNQTEISYSTPAQACRSVGALLSNITTTNKTDANIALHLPIEFTR